MSSAHRKGWCPGALRPMESGDGLIVRLRIVGGALDPHLTRALAHCAETFGNGLLDLSSRGNLQLRGVTSEHLPALQTRLDSLGLLDEDPEAEAVRNIVASPLAGLDPSALLDIRPQIRALDARLRKDKSLHRLPGKFLFMIDDGGCLPLPAEMADIAFVAEGETDDPVFAVYLAGKLAGYCAVDALCETAARLALAFQGSNENDGTAPRRMGDIISRIGTETLARTSALTLPPVGRVGSLKRSGVGVKPGIDLSKPNVLGIHDLGAHTALGLGVPLGRLDQASLHLLAYTAEALGGALRLAPWRSIFLFAERIGIHVAERLHDAGFAICDDAPIRAVAACPGKPACLHGTVSSQADAAHLAPFAAKLASSGIALHVSACAKGCAHPSAAPVTLVGRDGAYDLVLDGRAGDEPLLRGLSRTEVETLLQKLAEIAPADRAAFASEAFCEAAR